MNMSWADVKGAWAGVAALIIASAAIPLYLQMHMFQLDNIFAVMVSVTIQYTYLLSMILVIDVAMAITFFLIALIRGKS